MADLLTDHNRWLDRLRGIPNLTVFDGDVPTKPPADQRGYVLPYVVLWGSPTTPLYTPLSGQAADAFLGVQRLTAVGGDTARCLQGAQLVRAHIVGWTPHTSAGPVTEDPNPGVQIDRDVAPPRMYLPMQFRFTTT